MNNIFKTSMQHFSGILYFCYTSKPICALCLSFSQRPRLRPHFSSLLLQMLLPKAKTESEIDLERNVTGGSCALSTVADRLVRDGVLGEVGTDHLRLDLGVDESLSVIDTDDGSDHLWDDDHVTKVSLDRWRLLTVGSALLGDAQLL